jgi:hypothetical protein
MLIIAWAGERHAPPHQPNLFLQYRCRHGHYFETLKIFNGTSYEEHYIPFGEPKRDIRASIN